MTFSQSITKSGATTPELQPITRETFGSALHNKSAPGVNDTTAADVLCPCCGGSILRIWRRPSDRILSVFVPLHRYRCDARDCRWEGNIRQPGAHHGTDGSESSSQYGVPESKVSTAFVVHTVLVLIGVVFVFVVARIVWGPTGDDLAADSPWSLSERVGETDFGAHAALVKDPSLYRSTGR